MKVLLSPAKSLNYDQTIQTPLESEPHFLKEADSLAKKLQKMSKKKLGELMKLSENLTDLNYDRYQAWEKPTQYQKHIKPAITVFNGEVYKGFDAENLTAAELNKAQDEIRILSGLYGLLKPLDLLYPYRLEMGTRWNVTPKTKNLYAFWNTKLSTFLKEETEKDEVIINLASNEYFKSIDKKALQRRVITPVFKELKGNQYKIVMMYAKHSRGAMARNIVTENYSSVEDLKGYDVDGDSFNEGLSSENEWVFVR